MSFAKYKSCIEEGDQVIVYVGYDTTFPLIMKRRKTTQTRYGALKHDWAIGRKFGTKLQCTKGYVYILHPTPELWTISLPHRTQILYSTDIAMVTMQLDLKPGSVVCESGTGSGSLSHAILRTIMPSGYLHTVEFHEMRAQTAREEFKTHGFGDIVTVYHRDVLAEGFPVKREADAVFLDIPKPWEAIAHAIEAFKISGGRLCSFSPCMEQVQRTCKALRDSKCFEEIETLELVHKPYNVRRILLPIVDMGISEPGVREALLEQVGSGPKKSILPYAYEPGDKLPVGEIIVPDCGSEYCNAGQKGAKNRGRLKNPPFLKRKHEETGGNENKTEDESNKVAEVPTVEGQPSEEKDSKREAGYTPPTCTKNMFSTRTCSEPREIYGHTGYLTFASYHS